MKRISSVMNKRAVTVKEERGRSSDVGLDADPSEAFHPMALLPGCTSP
jgi:hypothetical protein